jgi:transcription elongation factor GreA
MAKEYRLTAEALKQLQEELHYLKTTREDEVAKQLAEARSYGDLSENSEYDAAKDEQGKLYSRIAEVEFMLDNYVLVDEGPDDGDGETVRIGSFVTVLDVEFGEEEEYEIVVSQEADLMAGRISEESPFGKALLGQKVGSVVVVEAPSGNVEYKIASVRR